MLKSYQKQDNVALHPNTTLLDFNVKFPLLRLLLFSYNRTELFFSEMLKELTFINNIKVLPLFRQ